VPFVLEGSPPEYEGLSIHKGALSLALSPRKSWGVRRLALLFLSSLAAILAFDDRPGVRGTAHAGVRVLLFDSQPLSRLGLRTACTDAGYDVEESAGAVGGKDSGEAPLVTVVVLRDPSDWRRLDACRQTGGSGRVVAVLPALEPALVQRCLAAGASGVVGVDTTPEELISTIDNAVSGRTLLPSDVARHMAQKRLETSESLSAEEVGWLRALARGRTVTELAKEKAYSERHLHRRLKAVYARLGVAGRTEALLCAARAGWL
jgi:DNA-binding NarL/FixJ family response regulator